MMWQVTLARRFEVSLGLVNSLAQLLEPRAADEDDLERLVTKAVELVWEYQ